MELTSEGKRQTINKQRNKMLFLWSSHSVGSDSATPRTAAHQLPCPSLSLGLSLTHLRWVGKMLWRKVKLVTEKHEAGGGAAVLKGQRAFSVRRWHWRKDVKDVKGPITWTWAGGGRVLLSEEGYRSQCAGQREEGGLKTALPCSEACLAADWPNRPPAHLGWVVRPMPLFLGTSLCPLWAMAHRLDNEQPGFESQPVSNSQNPRDLFWPRFPHHRIEGWASRFPAPPLPNIEVRCSFRSTP